jgi:hypothetical protein
MNGCGSDGAPIRKMRAEADECILIKVLTLLTSFIANDLNPYTTPYIFWKRLTALAINGLSAYTFTIEVHSRRFAQNRHYPDCAQWQKT